MAKETPLTERESLELITKMISKAKCDYEDTGISAIMWGSIITFCSLVNFIANVQKMYWLNNVWYLTFVAVTVQVFISMRESRRKRVTSYEDSAMGGIWISFGIAMFMFSFYTSSLNVPSANTIFLIVYGIPTFATGFTRRFKPMIIGGIACWVLAIANMYTPAPYKTLYSAAAAQLAWFIPGFILRARYLKAKAGNV
jgi:hypothetical protein